MSTSVRSVEYRVRVLPQGHQLDVAIDVHGIDGPSLRAQVPTWVPGAYGFLRYGRDLFNVSATDANGNGLTVVREGWSGFRIDAPPPSLTLRYRAGAFEPAWGELAGLVDHEFALLFGTRYLQVSGHRGPVRVQYDWPAGWPVHQPAAVRNAGHSTSEYASYAELLNTPVVAGRFEKQTIEVEGTPFHIVFIDRTVGFERNVSRLIDAIRGIAEQAHAVFGSFPFEDYSFIISFDPTSSWGLERPHGTTIALEPLVFIDQQQWIDAIRVIAHELFHAWNVCRLKPKPLGTPDFAHGSFSDGLWVAEGFTRWYEFLLCTRAGLMPPERVLANIVNFWRHLSSHPAYQRVTPADSSSATFLNHHKYPGSVNATIDYYDAGMLIAFDLDAALQFDGAGTLDDGFRGFYERFVGEGVGFTSEDVVRFFAERSEQAGALLHREVFTAGALSTPLMLETIGFELISEDVRQLGIVLRDDAGPFIADVLDDGPAATTGLAPGDEFVRVGGHPFHHRALRYLIGSEESVSVEVKRGARLLRFVLPVATRRAVTGMRWVGDEAQRERLSGWLGARFTMAAGESLDLSPFDNFHGTQNVI